MTTPAPPIGAAPVPNDPTPAPSRPGWRRPPRPGPEHLGLAAVLAVSATLNVARLAQNGYANIYYSAAIRSMLHSLHNFFFVAFDPAGLITVDKPPLGLWLQAASAKVFGFSALSMLLPQALAGVLAVGALYLILNRRLGAVPALAGSMALAVFPAFVAVSRDNNLDALLILLMVLACGAGIRAAETGRLRWLLGCAVLVGLAFNTKALAALLVVPGLGLAYLVCAPRTLARRLQALALAGLLGALVCVAWIGYVDLGAKSKRPFIGGSTNNTELNVTFAYNGLGRVGGQVGGPGRVPHLGSLRPHPRTGRRTPATTHGRRRLITFGGSTGPLRLVDRELGDQGGWLLGFAAIGTLALALVVRRRRDPTLALLLVLGSWFVAEAVVLSFGKGIIHPYYVSALGPGVAAMVGAGVFAMLNSSHAPWRRLLGAAALLTSVVTQIELLHREAFLRTWSPILVALVGLSALAILASRRLAKPALLAGLAALLVAPAAIARTTWDAPVQGTFPAAGPTQATGYGGLGVAAGSRRFNLDLLAYVRSHGEARRFEILTDASNVAAPLILLGARAAAVGGYSGTDPALSGPQLARLVRRGDARYMLLGGVYWDRGGNAATRAAFRACRLIPPSIWRARPGVRAASTSYVPVPSPTTVALYDCRTAAAGLASGRREPDPKPTRRGPRGAGARARRAAGGQASGAATSSSVRRGTRQPARAAP